MTGSAIEINVDTTEVEAVLAQFKAKVGSLKPALKIIGQIVRTSIVKNFEVSGRPEKWQALSPETLLTKKGGSILIGKGFRGGLMGSIHEEAGDNYVMVGTNKVYAAIQHFGGQAGRGKKVTIPARPYLMVQDEDWPEMLAELNDYLMG